MPVQKIGPRSQLQLALNLGSNYGQRLNRILGLKVNPANIQYHHLVPQTLLSRFGAQTVHSLGNVVPTEIKVHQAITTLRRIPIPLLRSNLNDYLKKPNIIPFEKIYEFEAQLWAYASSRNLTTIQLDEISHLLGIIVP